MFHWFEILIQTIVGLFNVIAEGYVFIVDSVKHEKLILFFKKQQELRHRSLIINEFKRKKLSFIDENFLADHFSIIQMKISQTRSFPSVVLTFQKCLEDNLFVFNY
jgi:hypothetical protein